MCAHSGNLDYSPLLQPKIREADFRKANYYGQLVRQTLGRCLTAITVCLGLTKRVQIKSCKVPLYGKVKLVFRVAEEASKSILLCNFLAVVDLAGFGLEQSLQIFSCAGTKCFDLLLCFCRDWMVSIFARIP